MRHAHMERRDCNIPTQCGQRCVIALHIEFGYSMASLMHKMTKEIQL